MRLPTTADLRTMRENIALARCNGSDDDLCHIMNRNNVDYVSYGATADERRSGIPEYPNGARCILCEGR